jgi:hypothetical protein
MIRRRLLIAISLVALGVLAVMLVGPASSATRKADVTVSDLAEPPDFLAAGAGFRESFSVANMGDRRAGVLTVRRFSTTRFFIDLNPDDKSGRIGVGKAAVSGIAVHSETSRRAKLRVPAGTASGNYFLVACADATNKIKESKEKNNCRVAGQSIAVGISNVGPPGPRGTGNEATIDRFTLAIGRPTIEGFFTTNPGDDEKSTIRKEMAKVGPISLMADCKRTTNGNDGAPDDPFTSPNSFDEDGDEAKILIYTDSGTVTFNSVGESSRRNIPPGEGASVANDNTGGASQTKEVTGGEGKHMAIKTARDPDQTTPEDDWAFGYRVGTIYINHSGGTQLIFTGYAGIDVLGADDQCVFGGTLKVVKLAA